MKTGFWLRNGKGKLAGATVYQQNGETVMREVVSPTNPKTEKQIIQRIIMHTVMQAYSKMKEICDHSFEGLKRGQDTMSYFMSQNVGFCREKVSSMQSQGIAFINMYNFVPLRLKGFTPNQYQVSMGSLPRIDCNLRDDDESKGFVPNIKTNTYQAVINAYGLQRGDQLTFLMIDANNAAQFGQCNFHFARVILDPTNEDYSQASLDTPFLDQNGKINKPSVRNEGSFSYAIDATKGLSFTYNGSLTCVACAVIVSRKMNDKWLRSTAYLTYQMSEEYSLGECIDMAANGTNSTIYAAADAYLNNAGQGGGAGAADSAGDGNTGGAGGNSNVSPDTGSTAAISNVSVDGNSLTMGTEKEIQSDSSEHNAVITLTANAAAAGYKFYLISGNETAKEATLVAGSNTINASGLSSDVIYTIKIAESDLYEKQATGYSFSYGQGW
jgi:hypothetical protein